MGMPPNLKEKQISVGSPPHDHNLSGISNANKLPHWLREDTNFPPSKQSEPHLPPTVSAIAQSVRLRYGEEKPTIPPFSIPGPPPLLPKDPRKSLKRKRKLHRLQQESPEVSNSTVKFNTTSSSPILPAPPTTTNVPSFPRSDAGLSLPSLNLNLNSPSFSSFDIHTKESSLKLEPVPEVPQLVTSSVSPVPSTPAALDMPSPTCQRDELPVPENIQTLEQDENDVTGDEEGIHVIQKETGNYLSACLGKLKDEETDQTENGDLSKTKSRQCGNNQIVVEEFSSKETVSDGNRSEQEP